MSQPPPPGGPGHPPPPRGPPPPTSPGPPPGPPPSSAESRDTAPITSFAPPPLPAHPPPGRPPPPTSPGPPSIRPSSGPPPAALLPRGPPPPPKAPPPGLSPSSIETLEQRKPPPRGPPPPTPIVSSKGLDLAGGPNPRGPPPMSPPPPSPLMMMQQQQQAQGGARSSASPPPGSSFQPPRPSGPSPMSPTAMQIDPPRGPAPPPRGPPPQPPTAPLPLHTQPHPPGGQIPPSSKATPMDVVGGIPSGPRPPPLRGLPSPIQPTPPPPRGPTPPPSSAPVTPSGVQVSMSPSAPTSPVPMITQQPISSPLTLSSSAITPPPLSSSAITPPPRGPVPPPRGPIPPPSSGRAPPKEATTSPVPAKAGGIAAPILPPPGSFVPIQPAEQKLDPAGGGGPLSPSTASTVKATPDLGMKKIEDTTPTPVASSSASVPSSQAAISIPPPSEAKEASPPPPSSSSSTIPPPTSSTDSHLPAMLNEVKIKAPPSSSTATSTAAEVQKDSPSSPTTTTTTSGATPPQAGGAKITPPSPTNTTAFTAAQATITNKAPPLSPPPTRSIERPKPPPPKSPVGTPTPQQTQQQAPSSSSSSTVQSLVPTSPSTKPAPPTPTTPSSSTSAAASQEAQQRRPGEGTRPINPETGLPYGKQPAPPPRTPPSAMKAEEVPPPTATAASSRDSKGVEEVKTAEVAKVEGQANLTLTAKEVQEVMPQQQSALPLSTGDEGKVVDSASQIPLQQQQQEPASVSVTSKAKEGEGGDEVAVGVAEGKDLTTVILPQEGGATTLPPSASQPEPLPLSGDSKEGGLVADEKKEGEGGKDSGGGKEEKAATTAAAAAKDSSSSRTPSPSTTTEAEEDRRKSSTLVMEGLKPKGRKPPTEAPSSDASEMKTAAMEAFKKDKPLDIEEEIGDEEDEEEEGGDAKKTSSSGKRRGGSVSSAASDGDDEAGGKEGEEGDGEKKGGRRESKMVALTEAALQEVKKRLKRGRLNVTLMIAKNVIKRDQIVAAAANNLNPYVMAVVGEGQKRETFGTSSTKQLKEEILVIKAKSTVMKKAPGAIVDFKKDMLHLNLVEPDLYLQPDGDIRLAIEMWDQGAWQEDDLMGRGEVSLLPFLDQPGSKFEFPLVLADVKGEEDLAEAEAEEKDPKKRKQLLLKKKQLLKNRPKMEMALAATFEQAKVGLLVFTLFEGRTLKALGGAINYVTVGLLGERYLKKSSNVKVETSSKGGTLTSNPYFKEEKVVMWASGDNWVDDALLRVYDGSEDEGASSDLIGETSVSVLSYMALAMTPEQFAPQSLPLFRKEVKGTEVVTEQTGQLVFKVEFLIAGKLSITIVEGRRLRKTHKVTGRQDPYVICKVEGQAVSLSRKTTVQVDAGADPLWNECITLDIVDQYLLEIEVWDEDLRGGSDEMIGKASFSLLSVYKKGVIETWLVIKRTGDDGSPEDAGEIHLVLEFQGPPGVAYPQLQPNVDAYDDRYRVNREGRAAKEEESASKQMDENNQLVLRTKEKVLGQGAAQPTRAKEFSEDEIAEAFAFIDMDHNQYISAAEIRHILICMGELVTDEEIDGMINLIDADGDGQVAFKEFYAMVMHPNLAKYECRNGAEDEEGGLEGSAAGPKGGGGEEGQTRRKKEAEKKADYEREREMMDREEKRKLFQVLCQDNNIGVTEARKLFDRYRGLSMAMLQKGTDFDLFCSLLGVLPTGQYHKLFNLFDREGGGYIDMKVFMLGLFNFINLAKDEKVSLIFKLFDEDRSGYLSEDEIREILKATHLQSAEGVQGKLSTLMKQVKNPDHTVTFEEFVIISKKFPNILFPPKSSLGAGGGDDAPQRRTSLAATSALALA